MMDEDVDIAALGRAQTRGEDIRKIEGESIHEMFVDEDKSFEKTLDETLDDVFSDMSWWHWMGLDRTGNE